MKIHFKNTLRSFDYLCKKNQSHIQLVELKQRSEQLNMTEKDLMLLDHDFTRARLDQTSFLFDPTSICSFVLQRDDALRWVYHEIRAAAQQRAWDDAISSISPSHAVILRGSYFIDWPKVSRIQKR